MNPTTIGRLLALNLAAATDTDEVRLLIQDHVDAFPRDEAVHFLTVALGTLAADILLPSVNIMSASNEWREIHRNAAQKIVAGPTKKEN